ARQRAGEFAQEVELCAAGRSRIEEGPDGVAGVKERRSAQLRKRFVGGAEAVREDQSTLLSDAPAVRDLSSDDPLAMRRTTEHKLFGPGRKFDLRFASHACAVENDRFLR